MSGTTGIPINAPQTCVMLQSFKHIHTCACTMLYTFITKADLLFWLTRTLYATITKQLYCSLHIQHYVILNLEGGMGHGVGCNITPVQLLGPTRVHLIHSRRCVGHCHRHGRHWQRIQPWQTHQKGQRCWPAMKDRNESAFLKCCQFVSSVVISQEWFRCLQTKSAVGTTATISCLTS